MQERCDMKEIQKMLGSFSCPELAELSALATKYKLEIHNFTGVYRTS